MSLRRNLKQNELVAKLVTGTKAPCVFCRREVDDEIIYGKLYVIGDIQCHYFCVLLASCLVQKGKDEEGLFGFLYKDILAEVERSKKHKCSYCSRGGATLGCSVSQCRKQFHLPCGRERNAVSLFFGNYKSFCQVHAPKQKITSDIISKVEVRRKNACRKIKGRIQYVDVSNDSEAEFVCAICYEEVRGFPALDTFWPPCCARDAWFHRSCLQRMALSAGVHYLKCPLCNDKENFHKAVLEQGYYIPDRDAAWELEQNAFAEIYERNLTCSAEDCKCPMGRNHDADNGSWEIRACLLCGSCGAHAACVSARREGATAGAYVCDACGPAAPDDLDSLAKTVQAVVLSEENGGGEESRPGPVMPSRMSLRSTKRSLRSTPSRSTDNSQVTNMEATDNVITSRRDLNLKTPRRQQQSPLEPAVMKNIDNRMFSPIKLLEQGFREKITRTGLDFDLDDSVLEDMRRRFKKPRPLSEKRKIVNAIVSGVFDNILKEPKQKETIKEWCSPKKISDVIEGSNEESSNFQVQQVSNIIRKDDTASLLVDKDKEKEQISSPEKGQISSAEEGQVTRPEKGQITSPEKKQITSPEIGQIASPEKGQISPEKRQIISAEEGQVTRPGKGQISSPEKGQITSPEKGQIASPEKEQISSAEEGQVTRPGNGQISSPEKGQIASPEKGQISSPEKAMDFSNPIVDGIVESSNTLQQPSEFITEENHPINTLEIISTDIILDTSENDLIINIDQTQEESIVPTVGDVNTAMLIDDNGTGFNETDSPLEVSDIAKPVGDDSDDSSSTFQLPPEFIADDSDNSVIVNTPTKLKTFDIQKDSSLEISENDNQVVNIDVVKIDSNCDDIEDVKPKSPFKIKKCALKFNPLDKKTIKDHDIGIDMECFKNYYLNEVDKDFKNNANTKSNNDGSNNDNVDKEVTNKRGVKRKRGKEIEGKKRRKTEREVEKKLLRLRNRRNKETKEVKLTFKSEQKSKKRRRKQKKIKIKLSINDVNIPVRIKWRREQQLKLKISEIRNRRSKKIMKNNKTTLKQYILNPKQFSSDEIIVKPEKEVSPPKRKYIKHEKLSDNLVQTSLTKFFCVKTPEKCQDT